MSKYIKDEFVEFLRKELETNDGWNVEKENDEGIITSSKKIFKGIF